MIRFCYGCQKRYPGCHDHCPEYRGELVVHIAQQQERKRQENIRRGLDADRIRAIKKIKKEGRAHR